MMRIITVAVFCLIYLSGLSQDSATKADNQLYFKPFSGWRMNGQWLSQKEFRNEIYKVPAAIPYYKNSVTNRAIGYSLIVPAVFFIFKGFKNYPIGSSGYGKNYNGYKIAGLVAEGFALYLVFRSHKQEKKAAKTHNDFFR